MKIKVDSKLGAGPGDALEPHVRAIYAKPGVRKLGIVELVHVERTEPAPESELEASVKMRIGSLEIAEAEQEGVLREALRALNLQRTATGTITEDGQYELTKETIRQTAGLLGAIETARLRAGLARWTQYARRVASDSRLTQSEIRHELQAIADGMAETLNWASAEEA